MGHYFEIGYKGRRQMTYARDYEGAAATATRLWGGCDWVRCKD